jgi:GntR family transcriptional repressor for pyruvate dehydrogenase complex
MPGRRKLSDELADRIRHHIIRNKLSSGDRLPNERDLIAQLGASRATVREALKSLEVQGLISNMTGPDGGARVAGVSVDHAISLLRNFFYFNPINARQMYQVRLQIEPELAASVVGHLELEHLAALEANVAMQEATPIAAANWKLHRDAEIHFHDILAAACPNPLLALTARFINQVIRATIDVTESAGPVDAAESYTQDNLACHRRILKALIEGDALKVRRLMHDHLTEIEPYVESLAPQIEPMPRHASFTTGSGSDRELRTVVPVTQDRTRRSKPPKAVIVRKRRRS